MNAFILSKIEEWRRRQVYIQFLPAYSPELNIIEALWKHCKYRWLSFNDWLSQKK